MNELDYFFKLQIKLQKAFVSVISEGIDKTPTEGSTDAWFRKLLRGNYNSFSFPIVFRQDTGYKYPDIMSTKTACLFLISEKLANFMIAQEMTGFKLFNVIAFDKKGEEPFKYYGLSITGVCGSVNFEKSTQFKKFDIQGNERNYYKGFPIDLSKWDGSDLFLPEGNDSIIITEKVAEKFAALKLINFVPTRLSEWEMNFG